jgi:hypothetical protein
MLKSKEDKIGAGVIPHFSDDSVRIQAGSFVFDNKWINFNGAIFKVTDYITSVLVGNRTRFFKDRNYAVFILVGLDPQVGLVAAEGRHVLFTTLQATPAPVSYSFLPLVGIVLLQDGSRDLNYGYLPLKDENVFFMSGYGNIIDKNLKGDIGDDSVVCGETGLTGFTGLEGHTGLSGLLGATGYVGPTQTPQQGATGLMGMTGINWDIFIPFETFSS